jgi:transposase
MCTTYDIYTYDIYRDIQCQIDQKYSVDKALSSETRQSICVLRNEGYSMQETSKKLNISYNAVYYPLHETVQIGPNQNRKRSRRPRCTTEQEDKYISV